MLPDWANDYVGIPYRLGGRDHDGVDCYGLVYLVLRARGLDPPEYMLATDAGTPLKRAKAFNAALLLPTWEKLENGEEGDVVVLSPNRLPTHCGIVLDETYMLHSENGLSACVERIRGVMWAQRIHGFYRLRP